MNPVTQTASGRDMNPVAPPEPDNPKAKIGATKAPLGVVPFSMMVYAAMQMHNGAGKYGRHNYRATGVGAQIYFEGLMRHAIAWWNGEELDEEGVPNLAGMAANLAIICDGMAHGYMHDDRPPSVDMRKLFDQAAAQVKANNERNAGRNPRHFTIKDKAFRIE